MTWKPVAISKEEAAAAVRSFSKKARFLLDEDVDPSLAPELRKLGWNVRTVDDASLRGHPDENIMAYAKREDRILITHDADFFDDRLYPPHQNPGVLIIPQAISEAVIALRSALPIVGRFRELFRGAKILVDGLGTIKIKGTDYTGKRYTTCFKYSNPEHALQWEEDTKDG